MSGAFRIALPLNPLPLRGLCELNPSPAAAHAYDSHGHDSIYGAISWLI